jgi:hypothetical protein
LPLLLLLIFCCGGENGLLLYLFLLWGYANDFSPVTLSLGNILMLGKRTLFCCTKMGRQVPIPIIIVPWVKSSRGKIICALFVRNYVAAVDCVQGGAFEKVAVWRCSFS